VQPNDLISAYQLTPEMSAKIESAFEGLASIGITYLKQGEYGPWRFHLKTGKDGERIYRALGEYAAVVVSDLFDNDQGKELHAQLVAVMTESQHGVLLKGLPEDPATKCLFAMGIKTLLGDNEDVDNWFSGQLPQTIVRRPIPSSEPLAFHRDGNPELDKPEEKSFLFMGSAQRQKMSAPTLFNKPKGSQVQNSYTDPYDDHHVAISFEPDEMVFINNKTLVHSTGKQDGDSDSKRHLFRYTVNKSKLAHSSEHMSYVKGLMKDVPAPENQEKLKEWLIKEIDKLKTYRQHTM